MGLATKAVSVENAVKVVGHRKKYLFPRHLDKTFKECIEEGKALRIQFKKLI